MGVPAAAGVSANGRSPDYPNDDANYVVEGTFAAVGPGKPGKFYGPFNVAIWAEYTAEIDVTAGSSTVAFTTLPATVTVGSAINSAVLPPGTTVATLPGGTDVTIALPIRSLNGRVTLNGTTISGLASTDWLLNATVTGYGIAASTEVSSIDVVADPDAKPPILGTVTINNAVTAVRGDGTQNEKFEFALENDGLTTASNAAATISGVAVVFNATLQLERSFDGGETWIPCNIGGTGTVASWSAGTPVQVTFGEPELSVYYRLNALAYTGISDTTLNYRMSTTGQRATTLAIQTI